MDDHDETSALYGNWDGMLKAASSGAGAGTYVWARQGELDITPSFTAPAGSGLNDISRAQEFVYDVSLKGTDGSSVTDASAMIADDEGGTSTVAVTDGGTLTIMPKVTSVKISVPQGVEYTLTPKTVGGYDIEPGHITYGWENITGCKGTLVNRANETIRADYKATTFSINHTARVFLDGIDSPKSGLFVFSLEREDGSVVRVCENRDGYVEPFRDGDDFDMTGLGRGYADSKTYTYRLRQTGSTEAGYDLDDRTMTVVATVTDNGMGTLCVDVTTDGMQQEIFNNYTIRTELAKTGGPGVWMGGLGVFVAGGLGIFALSRRKRRS